MPAIANTFARTCGSLAVAVLVLHVSAGAQTPTAGFDMAALNRIDAVVADVIALSDEVVPICVLIGHEDELTAERDGGTQRRGESGSQRDRDRVGNMCRGK